MGGDLLFFRSKHSTVGTQRERGEEEEESFGITGEIFSNKMELFSTKSGLVS